MTEGEQLMQLRTQLEEQGKANAYRFDSIEKKLDENLKKVDRYMDQKADRKEIDSINNKIWGLLSGLILAIVGGIITILHK
jgi:hypothetical protein